LQHPRPARAAQAAEDAVLARGQAEGLQDVPLVVRHQDRQATEADERRQGREVAAGIVPREGLEDVLHPFHVRSSRWRGARLDQGHYFSRKVAGDRRPADDRAIAAGRATLAPAPAPPNPRWKRTAMTEKTAYVPP